MLFYKCYLIKFLPLSIFENWFNYPHSSGFLLFLIGGWVILAAYHLFLYLQNRNSLYLLYGGYLLSICMFQVVFLRFQFEALGSEPLNYYVRYPEFWAEVSYLIYFFFAFKFLKFSEEFPRAYLWLKRALIILAIYSLICLIWKIIEYNNTRSTLLYHGYVAVIFLLSIITYVFFFKSKHPLRWYIIIGSLCLSIGSFASLFLTLIYAENGELPQWPYTYLYFGYMLETMIFALGLGHYQARIFQERNQSQLKLIEQLEENESLKAKVREKLERDVEVLSQKAEENKLENLRIRYEKELAELKVSALRSQMNPHFIFNSLNSIKRYIIDNEQENAVYYLNKFSKLIRKILSSSINSIIPLAEELEIASLYVNIENIRFNNSIDFDIQIEGEINQETLKIPSMILQPFLENAIWHGLSHKKEDKRLQLRVRMEGEEFLILQIIDNGIGRKKSAEIKSKKIHKRQSVGIKLTEDRLRTYSKDKLNHYDVQFIDLDGKKGESGTEVVIKIPLK
ncbi:MAG: histidine kinase [Flavobacteriaceae bacterium]|nr:histidine kinase [Flavobacteriaceae bacterium]